MTPWKYTDATKQVVSRTLDNGSVESCLVTVQAVQDWIAQGNTPLPADPAPVGITDSYRAMIRRGAETLTVAGNQVAAILLLKQIGE